MATTKWTLDPTHSEITFKVKHLMISNVKGEFQKFDIIVDGDDITKAQIDVNIDAASINTNSPDRDTHLKSADFFDAEKYPTLNFKGKGLTPVSGDEYTITGDLTMRGVTKPVTFNVELGGTSKDPWGNEKQGYSVEGKINRKDFGLNWNAALETGGVLVSEDVKLFAELQFVKSANA
jgi:polyisoprenoid-binding protein YceI